jgi:hypothetical protein
MQTLLIVICGLIIGHLIKKCNRLEAENRRFKSMPPLVPIVDLQYLQRYCPVAGTGDDEAFMFPSPEGALVRWQDVAPKIKPVAVADRMPCDSDCTVNPRTGNGKYCWGWVNAHPSIPLAGSWHMVPVLLLADEASHWLPWWAIFLPDTTPPTKPQPTGGRLIKEPRT